MLASLHVLAFFAALAQVAHAIPQPVLVGSRDSSIYYYPPGSWGYTNATDGFSKAGGFSVFVFVFQNNNEAEFVDPWRSHPPDATQTFEYWAYQRSDGGNASISFDNGPATVFDYYNGTSNGTDGPVLVYSTYSLSPEEHTVSIKNLFDARGTLDLGYGEMNVDHFVITPVSPNPTSTSTSPSSTPVSSSAAQTSSTQSSTPTAKPGHSSNHVSAIAGGVAGGVVGLALISVALFIFLRRGRGQGSSAPLMTQDPGEPESGTTDAAPEHRDSTLPQGSGPPIARLYELSILYFLSRSCPNPAMHFPSFPSWVASVQMIPELIPHP
ncbi:hypothetical protein BS47DRAFT_1389682 [Hydnum rufescens UP504]|uniref:Uncharacterized protein n=1 Tax=Hydnum rufescens UP504 TaxID=1448309 RepID=A0A9P6B4S3_9AGAM|nr:hypothetical protein BS47DRAFT_1389682 [Hydnum rufescens UP504]